MSEPETNPAEMRVSQDGDNELVELTVTRGTYCKGFGDVSPGDKIMVPANFQKDGVPPVRWWAFTKKAMTSGKAKAYLEQADATAAAVAEKKERTDPRPTKAK